MRFKHLLIVTVVLLGISSYRLSAQESFTSTGGEAGGASGESSYSIGQVTYTLISGSGTEVIAGVQQPYEISEVKTNGLYPDLSLHLTIYPNPAEDYLILSIENYKGTYLTFRLLDLNGRQLRSQQLTSDETRIPLQELSPATYLLNVVQNKNVIKSFKILKR